MHTALHIRHIAPVERSYPLYPRTPAADGDRTKYVIAGGIINGNCTTESKALSSSRKAMLKFSPGPHKSLAGSGDREIYNERMSQRYPHLSQSGTQVDIPSGYHEGRSSRPVIWSSDGIGTRRSRAREAALAASASAAEIHVSADMASSSTSEKS